MECLVSFMLGVGIGVCTLFLVMFMLMGRPDREE